jgi:hypothetical protein
VDALLSANQAEFSPEKKSLVRYINKNSDDKYTGVPANSGVRRTRNKWMWRQAMAKTDGDADVAAVLIHDAATGFAKVTETYEVKLRKVREAVKLQKQVVKALKQHFQDDYNSTHMKSFSGASDIKWDQLRACMNRKVDPNGDHRDLNLSDLDPELSSEVGTPSFLCSKTCAKQRTTIGKELGMEVLEEDGSAVQVMLLNRAIKESLLRKGIHRAKREVNEQIVGAGTPPLAFSNPAGTRPPTSLSSRPAARPTPTPPGHCFHLFNGSVATISTTFKPIAGALLKRLTGRFETAACGSRRLPATRAVTTKMMMLPPRARSFARQR